MLFNSKTKKLRPMPISTDLLTRHTEIVEESIRTYFGNFVRLDFFYLANKSLLTLLKTKELLDTDIEKQFCLERPS